MTTLLTPPSVRRKIRLVFTGHVDHGKSTVIGRLLYDTGSLPEGAVAKIKKVSAETGQPFELAFLLDAFEEEQKQGITIDTTRLQFKTEHLDYVIIDAPGHKEFLKNMISGAADAEAAFLVVDAQRGVEEQSRRHALVLKLLGLTQIGLIINKMDLVDFEPKVFQSVSSELTAFLESLGLSPKFSIPVSALNGDNIVNPSSKTPWYHGPTLVKALDDFTYAPEHGTGLRLPLQDVYKFDDRRLLAGRIESGVIHVGDEILISPGHKKTKVTALAAWLDRDKKDSASSGESVGVMVSDEFFNRRGEVISLLTDAPTVSSRFTASIFWMGKNPLKVKKRYKLRLATSESEAQIARVLRLIDSETLAERSIKLDKPANGSSLDGYNDVQRDGHNKDPRATAHDGAYDASLDAPQDAPHDAPHDAPLGASFGKVSEIGFNQTAEVEIVLQHPLAIDLFSSHRATGRFVLIDGFDVAGGGIVTQIEERLPIKFGFVGDGLIARCEVFEEYFYDLNGMTVSKIGTHDPMYCVGDAVPLVGYSYHYPENFDIVVFRDQVAITIRQGKVAGLTHLSEHSYEGFPVVNGRGFGVLIASQEDFNLVRHDYERLSGDNEARLAERWLDFNTFRRIPIGSGDLRQTT
ncbi:MAG: 50S ribosome-binding GTPase [Deltaproteobacteria bacterium]|nr:50S ribosome-binding GTPase [Deltaproteobacteria bacterium]